MPGEHAAKAALDGALHDLQGKLLGIPAYRLLGLPRTGPPTSWTVWLGDPDDMARRAEKAAPSFLRLKLKLGGGDGLDVERVRAVRTVTDRPLQVDVNEWWSLEEALDALPQLAELGVEYCEQPLRAGDEGGRVLRERSPVPIYVDEDCHTLSDVPRCAEIAHGINIKLSKSGRDPGGDPDGARGAVARARRDARVHARVRARDRGGLLRGAALRPRRPRRKPAPARGPVAGRRLRRRRPDPVRAPGLGVDPP